MTVVYRQASLADLDVLTGFNAGLQRDQGGPQPSPRRRCASVWRTG